ncbi:hypothetical protein SDC9_127741 [bioreactor metagenome]|uniref:Uncharacterized protein n=1 Tax=bioreactor metagenome TaxID=1076179 RepID=A0A645CUW8_9ZZZZ
MFERDGRKLVTVALKSEYGSDDTNVFNDTKKIADYGYDAKKQVFKKAGEKVGTVDLEYKVFGLFGPKKSIEAPIVASNDIMYYKNDINDKSAKVEYDNKDKSAWKLANKKVDLTFSLPNYKSKIPGKIDLSVFDLIKDNIGVYATAIVGTILSLGVIAYSVKFINRKKRYNRRNKNIYKRR